MSVDAFILAEIVDHELKKQADSYNWSAPTADAALHLKHFRYSIEALEIFYQNTLVDWERPIVCYRSIWHILRPGSHLDEPFDYVGKYVGDGFVYMVQTRGGKPFEFNRFGQACNYLTEGCRYAWCLNLSTVERLKKTFEHRDKLLTKAEELVKFSDVLLPEKPLHGMVYKGIDPSFSVSVLTEEQRATIVSQEAERLRNGPWGIRPGEITEEYKPSNPPANPPEVDEAAKALAQLREQSFEVSLTGAQAYETLHEDTVKLHPSEADLNRFRDECRDRYSGAPSKVQQENIGEASPGVIRAVAKAQQQCDPIREAVEKRQKEQGK